MFFHDLKYFILSQLKTKNLIFWLLLFPIALGCFFRIAFGEIYGNLTQTEPIPVAVVEEKDNPVFRSVLESMQGSKDRFLDPVDMDEATALDQLKNNTVEGILYINDKLRLTVAEDGLEETMLKKFVETYTLRETILTDAALMHPEKIEAAAAALSKDCHSVAAVSVTAENTNNFTQYFYNLIAMTALYGSLLGMQICFNNQANLSALGARKSCSPISKAVSLAADLTGAVLLQFLCMAVCVTFLVFVLKIDLGNRLPLVYLAACLGGLTGVSIGFFVGSVGTVGQRVRTGICNAVVLLLCFFSGLMVGNMKALVARFVPWLNEINPAAVISDSIYCLNLYSDYRRFGEKLAAMLLISLLFCILGIIMTRRKQYADI